jgi:hypothetical protein
MALNLPLADPDNKNAPVPAGSHTKGGNALIGQDPSKPEVVVTATGGSDFIYLPTQDKALATRVVQALLAQDYTSGIFVNDELGSIPGALPLSAINLKGAGLTVRASILVNFRSFIAPGCNQPQPILCTVEVADTDLQHGQGMHGNFSRTDTMNFMAAAGPDFKTGFADETPTSNADIGQTITHILGLKIPNKGTLIGRVIEESLPGGKAPQVTSKVEESAADPNGLKTILVVQQVGQERYLDAAGFPGRTIGLPKEHSASR